MLVGYIGVTPIWITLAIILHCQKATLRRTLHGIWRQLTLTADGLLDLVISNTQDEPYYKGNVLQALTNNGDRTFTDPAFRAKEETDGVGYIYILDFNHDGVDDIVVVSDHRTYALINNGDGTYTETSQFAVPDTFSLSIPIVSCRSRWQV